MAKKTRNQLIEEAQQLFKTVHGVKLPPEQLDECLDWTGGIDSSLVDILYEILDVKGTGERVRLAFRDFEPEDPELDGKHGFDEVNLYDHETVLKLFVAYLKKQMGTATFIVASDGDTVCAKRSTRTNANLRAIVKALTKEQDHNEEVKKRRSNAVQWDRCKTVLEKAIDRVGEKKALAAAEAALKKIK